MLRPDLAVLTRVCDQAVKLRCSFGHDWAIEFTRTANGRREVEKVMADPVLRVEMQDTEFVITMPGTSYQVTFRKLADGPGFSASHNIRDDWDAPITRSEFLARAWRIANDKARELGWIALGAERDAITKMI
jgi:hypothetical protein